MLLHQLKGIGQYRKRLGALRRPDREADSFVLSALFTTMTNVNFDDARFAAGQKPDVLDGPASFV